MSRARRAWARLLRALVAFWAVLVRDEVLLPAPPAWGPGAAARPDPEGKRFRVVWDVGGRRVVAMDGARAVTARDTYLEGKVMSQVMGGAFYRNGQLVEGWGTMNERS